MHLKCLLIDDVLFVLGHCIVGILLQHKCKPQPEEAHYVWCGF